MFVCVEARLTRRVQLISDKETLVNFVTASHDFRLSCLEAQEETLVTGIHGDLETNTKAIFSREIQRNRDRVNDVLMYRDQCTNELSQAEEELAA